MLAEHFQNQAFLPNIFSAFFFHWAVIFFFLFFFNQRLSTIPVPWECCLWNLKKMLSLKLLWFNFSGVQLGIIIYSSKTSLFIKFSPGWEELFLLRIPCCLDLFRCIRVSKVVTSFFRDERNVWTTLYWLWRSERRLCA